MKKYIILMTSCLFILIVSCATVPNAGTEKLKFSDDMVDNHIRQLVTLWSEKASTLDENTFNMLSDVPVDSLKINHTTETGHPQAVISLMHPMTHILFEFTKPTGNTALKDIKIKKLFIFEYFDENVEPGDFQKWADSNNDGILDEMEQEQLYITVLDYENYRGRVRNSFDDYFDLNGDAYIDDIESGYAEDILHHDLPHRMYSAFPLIARNFVDIDGNDYISIHLVNGFFNAVFDPDFYKFGRRNTKQWDKMADVNSDGYVNKEELGYFVHLIGIKISLMPAPPVAPKDTIILHNEIRRWADFNGNGEIDYYEVDDVAWKLYEFFSNFHNLALNPLDSFFNLNQNFFIENFEKVYAFNYLLSNYLNNLKESIPGFVNNFMDINSNGTIEKIEIEEANARLSSPSTGSNRFIGGKGKTLAIMKSTSPDKKLEQSVGEVILSFIQNAFVTSGKYRIVDRRNLDVVMGEQNLALSGIVKESDAVEIGQIAGAELVGVAELYRLDSNYFLNLKLLSSTRGEVVNSSIAQAGAIGEFLSMCNDAVNNLNK